MWLGLVPPLEMDYEAKTQQEGEPMEPMNHKLLRRRYKETQHFANELENKLLSREGSISASELFMEK